MTTVSLQYCPITVDDVDTAISFYRDALGLEILNDVASDGHRWATLGPVGSRGAGVVLSDAGAGRSDDDAAALQRLIADGAGPGPYLFATADLDAAFARARDTGAEVLQEPTTQPWGARDCAFRDPAGNLVRINQAG